MLVLVTGVAGQLGFDVVCELKKRGIDYIGTDVRPISEVNAIFDEEHYYQLDITNEDDVTKRVLDIKPDVIVHCAAWTNVDGAESQENKPLVKKINVNGTANLAKTAKIVGAKFVYISTDYVFNGEGTRPWQPDDISYAPLNYYGQTKLEGEQVVSSMLKRYFIVRIAWVFGLNGKNFVKTIGNLAEQDKNIRVVNDQFGTPTYTYDLARLLVDMILTDKYGYYHATNEGGYISWYEFAAEIYRLLGKDSNMVASVTTEEYGQASITKRPKNSRLDKQKLIDNGFKPLPEWKDALARYIDLLKENHIF